MTSAVSDPAFTGRTLAPVDGTAPTQLARPVTRGRPRDQSHDGHILTAAIRLLEHTPYSKLSMAAVAREAGVGKPTLYLRWSSKAALVADAVVQSMTVEPYGDSGTLRSDLVNGITNMVKLLGSVAISRALPGLLADLREDTELNESFQQRYFAPRRASIHAALDRAVARGELRPDVDLELVIDQLVGPLYFRVLTRGTPVRTDPGQLVDFVIGACEPVSQDD